MDVILTGTTEVVVAAMVVAHGTDGTAGITAAIAADATAVVPGQTGIVQDVLVVQTGVRAVLLQRYQRL